MLSDAQFCIDWVKQMGEFTPLTAPNVAAYIRKREEALRAQADAQPVAWRHNLTHCLYETEAEVEFGDGDEWAEPLYLHSAPEAAQAGLSDGEIQALWDEACHDTPQKPGWRRHIRFARSIESAILTRASAATVAEPSEDAIGKLKAQTTITLRQAEALLAFFGGHDSEVALASHDGGLIAWGAEYPEEGSFWLGKTEVDDDLAVNGRQAKPHARSSRIACGLEPMGGFLPPEATKVVQQAEPVGDERAAFEDYERRTHGIMSFNKTKSSLQYAHAPTEDRWLGWQARAAQSGQRAGVADDVREIIAAYVADERRYLDGKGEPYGSISTDIGMRARALLAAAPTPAAQGGV